MDARSEEKRHQLERALEHGVVMIHLDARRPGVLVPARFKEDFHLRLKVSLRYDPPDLTVGEWGIRETLSFGGSRFAVAMPWTAIFAITGDHRNDQAFLYPEEMPKELFEEAARHFGLEGNEAEHLRDQAQGMLHADLEPDPVQARARAALRLVIDEDGLEESPELDEAHPSLVEHAGNQASVEQVVEQAAVENKPEGPRRGHLKLVK